MALPRFVTAIADAAGGDWPLLHFLITYSSVPHHDP
jgi:hypothetical protein